jgi:outer membrane protein OmpA-like peptidoglycan-associated protein
LLKRLALTLGSSGFLIPVAFAQSLHPPAPTIDWSVLDSLAPAPAPDAVQLHRPGSATETPPVQLHHPAQPTPNAAVRAKPGKAPATAQAAPVIPAEKPAPPAEKVAAAPAPQAEQKVATLATPPATKPAPATSPAIIPVVAPAVVAPRLDSVRFVAGATDLPQGAQAILDQAVVRMNADAQVRLQLFSYASGSGDDAIAARRVSLARATAMRTYLIEKGVHSIRVDVRALGSRNEGDGPADRVDLVYLDH